MNIIRNWVVVLVLMFVSVFAYAGGGSSDGVGSPYHDFEHGSAWFIEDRPVSYCVVNDPKISNLNNTDVLQAIDHALKKWIDFYKIFENVIKKNGFHIETNFEYQSQCRESTDLTFYFSDIPQKYKEVSTRNSSLAAFSYTLSTEKKEIQRFSSNKKGFIYVRTYNINLKGKSSYAIPNWKKDDNLYAILLHEVGHIFGVKHIPGTIMDKEISFKLSQPPLDPTKNIKGMLDLRITLKQRKKISHYYNILNNEYIGSTRSFGVNNNLKLIFENKDKYYLEDKDLDRIYTFHWQEKPVSADPRHPSIMNNNYFYIEKREDGKTSKHITQYFTRHFVRGVVELNGNLYPAIYEKNMDKIRHRLSIFQNGNWKVLFKK